MTILSAGAVLMGSLIIIFALIILFSKKAVKPIAESYEKQKQFITDANHELKTPLTLVLANLDIVEAETGKNEWLDDIRVECERMNDLVRQLVILTKTDETETPLSFAPFTISDMAMDMLSEFAPLAAGRELHLLSKVQPGIVYNGDESAIRHVFSILLENAIKYCDEGGKIEFTLQGKRRPVITVENSCKEVNTIELKRLFDRFYRADKARVFTGGFGIGLSIAKSIVHRHHGEIWAYKKDSSTIGFKIILK
jgi:two-component system sensor histidine kinase CiaH